MLKLGSVKWRGKCSKHPGFDPAMDGPGAVKGNCPRCSDLMDIYQHHQRMLQLMRNFRPVEDKRPEPDGVFIDERQLGLF